MKWHIDQSYTLFPPFSFCLTLRSMGEGHHVHGPIVPPALPNSVTLHYAYICDIKKICWDADSQVCLHVF